MPFVIRNPVAHSTVNCYQARAACSTGGLKYIKVINHSSLAEGGDKPKRCADILPVDNSQVLWGAPDINPAVIPCEITTGIYEQSGTRRAHGIGVLGAVTGLSMVGDAGR